MTTKPLNEAKATKSPKELKVLSKFLSTLLRHQAAAYDLEIDEQGYADFGEVWGIVEGEFGKRFTKDDLGPVLDGSLDGKQRLERNDAKIRALYGHSRVTLVEYPVVIPPKTLYHGTTPQALESIRETGLLPMSRQYVHLSITPEWAQKVARRKGNAPVLLQIRASEAYQAGIAFHHPEEHHYLAKAIPPQFLLFPEAP